MSDIGPGEFCDIPKKEPEKEGWGVFTDCNEGILIGIIIGFLLGLLIK